MTRYQRLAVLALWDLYVADIAAGRYGSAFLAAKRLCPYGLAVAEVAHGGAL